MAGRIWSAVAAVVLALGVSALITSTSAADGTGPVTAAPTIEPTAAASGSEAAVGGEGHWVNPGAKVRVPLVVVVVTIVAALGLAGPLGFSGRPDPRPLAPTRLRHHVIVSRGPPVLAV
jgi:hypothetical protein